MVACKARTIITILLALVAMARQAQTSVKTEQSGIIFSSDCKNHTILAV